MHNLAVAEATEFPNDFYIRVKETSTEIALFFSALNVLSAEEDRRG